MKIKKSNNANNAFKKKDSPTKYSGQKTALKSLFFVAIKK
jgi:hypothetical protein